MRTLIPRPLRLAALALCAVGGCSPAPADAQKIELIVGDQRLTATMEDSAAARAFLKLLPVSTTLEDFNNTAEKIYYPAQRLTAEGCRPGCAPEAGDIAIYLPWGTVAIFCKPVSYSRDLLRIGRLDGDGIRALQVPGDLEARIRILPRSVAEKAEPGALPKTSASGNSASGNSAADFAPRAGSRQTSAPRATAPAEQTTAPGT